MLVNKVHLHNGNVSCSNWVGRARLSIQQGCKRACSGCHPRKFGSAGVLQSATGKAVILGMSLKLRHLRLSDICNWAGSDLNYCMVILKTDASIPGKAEMPVRIHLKKKIWSALASQWISLSPTHTSKTLLFPTPFVTALPLRADSAGNRHDFKSTLCLSSRLVWCSSACSRLNELFYKSWRKGVYRRGSKWPLTLIALRGNNCGREAMTCFH